jgi:hypothetical protein
MGLRRICRAIAPVLALAVLSALSGRSHPTWGAREAEAYERLPGDELVPTVDLQTNWAIDSRPLCPTPGRGSYRWARAAVASTRRMDRERPRSSDPQPRPDRSRSAGVGGRRSDPAYSGDLSWPHSRSALERAADSPAGGPCAASRAAHGRIQQLELHPEAAARATRPADRPRSHSAPHGWAAGLMRWLELLLLEPGYFMMERGMLRGIKHRAEALGLSLDPERLDDL